MKQETLQVMIYLFDSFLAIRKETTKSEIQCLGVTCLHIAGKYEEIHPPSLKQLLRVVNNSTLERTDILKMEFQILSALEFQVVCPSVTRIGERLIQLAGM
jgi:hypothetical protein